MTFSRKLSAGTRPWDSLPVSTVSGLVIVANSTRTANDNLYARIRSEKATDNSFNNPASTCINMAVPSIQIPRTHQHIDQVELRDLFFWHLLHQLPFKESSACAPPQKPERLWPS